MPPIRQLSFSGGELSPDLRARSDLAKHASGLALCRNFFISKRGQAVSRPGTNFCGTAKNGGPNPVRLVPFIFSDGQAFCLEFGDTSGAGAGYVRFYQNGGVVLNGGSPYEVATTYKAADLFQLKFSQLGNVITITHQNYPPAELTRVTNTNWTLGAVGFTVPGYNNGGTILWSGSATVSAQPSPWVSTTNYVIGSVVTWSGHAWVSTQGIPTTGQYNNNNTPSSGSPWWVQDDTLLGRAWSWIVTALYQVGGTGPIIEGQGYGFGPGGVFPLDESHPANITLVDNSSPHGVIWGFKIYRGLSVTAMGLVGITTAAGAWTDVGVDPDYTQNPPQSYNPFTGVAQTPINITGTRTTPPGSSVDYPSCSCYFEQARVFARTPSRPGYLFKSQVGNYYNYDLPLFPSDASSMTFELASRQFLEVRSLLGFQAMLAFCNNGVWSIGGPNGQPLTPSGLNTKEQTELGASWLTPLQIQDAALYARAKGTGIRELLFNFMEQKFAVIDLSLFSEHLFTGYTINDWTYAEDPWSVIWAVRSDGKMLSLTYVRDQEVAAWAWHDTQGNYESVCAVPNGTVDDVYVSVARTVSGVTTRFIERMANRVFTTATDAKTVVCLDCCAAPYNGSPATIISGLSYLNGYQVYAFADGEMQGPFTVSGGQITLTTAASYVTVGLTYTPQMQRLPLAMQQAEVRNKEKTVAAVSFEIDASRGVRVGQDLQHLEDAMFRQVSDGFGYEALQTGLWKVRVASTYDFDGSACLEVDFPLPVTVTGITVDVEVGDD